MEKSENLRIMNCETPALIVDLEKTVVHSYDKWEDQTVNYGQWNHNYIMGVAITKYPECDYKSPRVIAFYDYDSMPLLSQIFQKPPS